MKVSKASAYSLHALMYMVRHITQLPVTANTIAKAEGIPRGYLIKLFQKLVKAGFVKSTKAKKRGYVFNRSPEDISLLELFEFIEGKRLFDDCLLKHCECGGTPENCCIFAQWVSSTKKMKQLLAETSLVTATWNHPEHRFYSLPESLEKTKKKATKKVTNPKVGVR